MDIYSKVVEIISSQLRVDPDNITESSAIVEDLGADSLDAVELSLAGEEKTGITIDEDAMAEIKTVADIVNYLEAHK